MKRNFYPFAVLLSTLIMALAFSSCLLQSTVNGNGNVKTEERNIDEFNALKISRGMNVYVSQGNDFKVVVEADENLHKSIVTELNGDELQIKAVDNIRKASSKKVFVTLPKLFAVEASSGSNVFSEQTLAAGDIKLTVSSGANLKFSIDADNVTAKSGSGSNMFLDGTTGSINAKSGSGSNIKAGDLKAQTVEAKVSSGANIWVNCQNKLQATASSGGNIFFYGNPANTSISKSSGGNVIKK